MPVIENDHVPFSSVELDRRYRRSPVRSRHPDPLARLGGRRA